MSDKKEVLVTGDRPTGRLHLGHLVGSLNNRIKYQQDYKCYFLIADLHMLTTHFDKVKEVEENVIEMVIDWLSVGMDPNKSTFYLQSEIPYITELYTILAMLCSVARSERIPTLKEKIQDMGVGENYSVGLLGYPILMAADILMYKAVKVPVGEDQLSHIEITRELARRFNHIYGEYFTEPEPIISETSRLVGTDGDRKMSKSLDNCIYLSDDEKAVGKRVMSMFTDPNRIRADIPGKVEGNPVFIYHDAFNDNTEEVDDLKDRYRKGKVGDVEVKKKLSAAVNNILEPIREKRSYYEQRRDEVKDIIKQGTIKAKEHANVIMNEILDHIGMYRPM
ncbi:MAG: tryptophan--tRNA ligase [Candidatus Dadabacteria bacterium]|nr:tryptophan--tRNA ligase [Candidatus Dadabacteria bacterium]NIX14703.1 tryptophan--tRNA ligase [Candidatus Dadabacteria bacterium]NIY21239.1 tryptophan--tRNA ligase [Candidatus Dadabacteria bacterium]